MNRRRKLEIYFVLYLAALMLLLSESPRRETDLASTALRNLLASTFTLYADRTTLLCRAQIERDSVHIVYFDSTATIIATGMVDSVQYTVTVEDQASGTQYTLQPLQTLHINTISFTTEQIGQALRLRWNIAPRLLQPKLYRLKITASAHPLIPSILPEIERQQLVSLLNTTILSAQLSLLVGYLPEQGISVPQPTAPLDSVVEARIRALIAQRSSVPSAPAGPFTIVPEHSTIRTLPFVEWENRISVYGADLQRDLAESPQVAASTPTFVTIEGNTLRIRSMSTQPTISQVRVLLTRRDGSQASTTFTVVTQALASPQVPSIMYPGVEYRFVPNLNTITGISTQALLRDQRGNIRVSSAQGESFSFTPSLSDTGMTFYFERLIGNKPIGQVIAIGCEQFPPPEIMSIQRQSDRSYIVRCRGYGLADDPKSRLHLEIEPPFAGTSQELYGEYVYEPQTHTRLHTFQITLTGSKISMRAVNGYGRKSEQRLLSP